MHPSAVFIARKCYDIYSQRSAKLSRDENLKAISTASTHQTVDMDCAVKMTLIFVLRALSASGWFALRHVVETLITKVDMATTKDNEDVFGAVTDVAGTLSHFLL